MDKASAQLASANILTSALWLAPEAMQHKMFSKASDVYSFAVILWEVCSCDLPWNGGVGLTEAALASVRCLSCMFVPSV